MGRRQGGAGGRLVVVGASPTLTVGPLQPEILAGRLARFIDGADLVIRMNDLKNRNAPGVGRRTDVLAVMNQGAPGVRYAHGPRIEHPLLDGLREILFVAPPEDIARHGHEQPDDPAAAVDLAGAIVAHQGWSALETGYIRAEVVRDLRTGLAGLADGWSTPSTGARVVAHVLSEPRFAGFQLFLVGFGFQGWPGHSFAAEHRYCLDLRAAGRLSGVPSVGLPHRAAQVRAAVQWLFSRRARRARRARREAQPAAARASASTPPGPRP